MRLVVIGGGFVRHFEHDHINKRIVELVGKAIPKVLFIPTASNDDEGYIKEFKDTFEKQLGCQVAVLRCVKENPNESQIIDLFSSCDFIYLGGGNYVNMMKYWKAYKVDYMLEEALHAGTLIAGISAGAICWFKSGIRSNYEGEGYIESPGWRMINKVFCPHYNQRDRADALHSILLNGNRTEDTIALEDDCALYFTDNAVERIGDPSKAWSLQVKGNKLLKRNL